MTSLEPHDGPEMRVTLGEVNRNVLSLRGDFREYVGKHAEQHRDHDDDHSSAGRWILTTAISIGGLVLALLANLTQSRPPA